jgi:TRAP-type uncharacterized transport system substrate-binding protein
MPPRLPKRPPLAMKLWLSQRFGRQGKAESSSHAHASGKSMSIESLEHIVRSRFRMFLRHTWLVAIIGSLIIGGCVWAAFYFMTAPDTMRIAVGPAGSVSEKIGRVLLQKFADDKDKIQLHLVATGGPKDSVEALSKGAADLAVVPSTANDSANWPVVAILQQNVVALIVPAPAVAVTAKKEAPPAKKEAAVSEKKEKPAKTGKGAKGNKGSKQAKTAAAAAKASKAAKSDKGNKTAKSEDTDADEDDSPAPATTTDANKEAADAAAANKLDSIPKLAGQRIGIVTDGAATADLLNVILNHYGVASDKVQVSLIDPRNLAEAVNSNQIDVIFIAGPATGHAISEAVTAASRLGQAPTFIPIDQADGIAKRIPTFDSVDIDAGTFGGHPPSPDDSLKSLSFPEYLVARKSFSHDAIGTLAKLIFTSRLAIASAMLGEIKIEAPSTDKDAATLVHPGALTYLNDDQKSFFDKYGDDIFYGLLIFPIFGSAIAGVASYFQKTGRTRRLRLLQRLLDLVRKAHAAPSLEALDEMQVEVDHLVVAIVHQSEREEYDQTVQASFSLALDQVRFAIATRRSVLLGDGAEGKVGGKAAAA